MNMSTSKITFLRNYGQRLNILSRLSKKLSNDVSKDTESMAKAQSKRKSLIENGKLSVGPDLNYFIRNNTNKISSNKNPYVMKWQMNAEDEPYLDQKTLSGNNSKVYIKTYGCQMNVNDTEIASSILEKFNYQIVNSFDQAEIVFLMTCSIRENAENKVWTRLKELNALKRQGRLKKFGLLGCMAERLKTKVLDKIPEIDIVAGPDSYRHLPKLLAINSLTGQSAVNVMLSLDETYDGIMPTSNLPQLSSYVSITRGCNNMCSFCIVPYTRGQERSRTIDSILNEIQIRIQRGSKEIILLGQNVNSYRDFNTQHVNVQPHRLATGFSTIYKQKSGGSGFEILLDQVAQIDPNVRIRFTSPHPKDFNDSVLNVIAKHKNIAKGLHLPVQSGSDVVLERMRRGYTRQAYLDLVQNIRQAIPDCGLSSDFICGFCAETDDDHRKTLDLIEQVGYYIAYIFAYSMRNKTYAFHHLNDNVPHSTKINRLIELNECYRKISLRMNQSLIGQQQLILLEASSKKSPDNLYGRNEANQKVIIPKRPDYQIGDFVQVHIVDCTPVTLIGGDGPQGQTIKKTNITEFYLN